jgi:S-DNA-T family DNA segregation ATPase FtsK/SpoIIIE
VNVVDGSIKSNFPTRIALKTSSSVDSQVILDRDGAEKLLGKGDMLVMDSTKSDLQRLQGFGE